LANQGDDLSALPADLWKIIQDLAVLKAALEFAR
jgi:hypothetical protein